MRIVRAATLLLWLTAAASPQDAPPEHPLNTWVKRTPLEKTPPSPRLGYEGDCIWDPVHRVILRYGGHNQGGGGEQGSEVWTCEPFSGTWTLHHPNIQPPGVCCEQQNVFDPIRARYVRFPSFSASHGWQWHREVYLNTSAVWTYDIGDQLWRNLRPVPAPPLAPLRCASWDSEHEVAVVFGGEGSSQGTLVYDPYANTWAWMKPALQPPFRSGGNMTYDVARRQHVLFGAQFTDDPVTWAYDLKKNEWRDLKPAASPPSAQNDAVLKYDAVGQVVLAIIKKSQGKDEDAKHQLETWVYDGAGNAWKKMDPAREPDVTGNRCRVLMAAPELNLIFLENCPGKPREQQIWSYRYADAKPPAPAAALRVTTEADAATLGWTPRAGTVAILRGSGERPWEIEFEEIARVKGEDGQYRDKGLRPGTVYHYRLAGVSLRARTQPRPPEDVVVSVLSEEKAEISWKPSPEADVVGYRVEQALVKVATDDQLPRLKSRTPPLEMPSVGAIRSIGEFRRLIEVPKQKTSIGCARNAPLAAEGKPLYERSFGKEDFDAEGKSYPLEVRAYRVRAVNALGVESGPSEAVVSIPGAVQGLVSKEEGTTAKLRWKPNREEGIRGYRVYRMDGRFDKEPVTRLTPQPIDALEFADPEAGKKSRRYYVVAVDALGQEGYPSSPVWFDREWKKFYEPFIAGWHQ